MKKTIALVLFAIAIATGAYGEFFNYEAHNITGNGGTISGFLIPWSQITSTPTTCVGYGITDCGSGSFRGSVPWDNITNKGSVTTTEMTYLHGTTSSIQTQLGLKAPIYSPVFTGNVTISGGTIDNTVIGGSTPTGVTATYLTSTGTTSFQAGASIPSDQEMLISDWSYRWDSTNQQIIFKTDNTAGLNDGTPMFVLRAANNGVLETGQEVFAVQDNTTSIFKVSQGGNVTITGELTATQITTSGGDNTHFINVMNTGPPGSPSKGDCYFDNTLNAWRCYSTSSTWVTSNISDNSVTPAKLQSSSGTADNTTYYRGDGAWGTVSTTKFVHEITNSTPYNLSAANASDAIIHNASAGSDNTTLNLPEITENNLGMRVTVIHRNGTSTSMTINPNDADRIRGVTGCTTNAYGDALRTSPVVDESVVVLVAGDTDTWTCVSYTGTWADVN